MGSTHRGTWKRREREAAAIFGALRQRLSGSSGRDDQSRSDSTHPRLFLEVKLQARTPTRAVLDLKREPHRKDPDRAVGLVVTADEFGPASNLMAVVHSHDLDRFLRPRGEGNVLHTLAMPRNAVLSLLAATTLHAVREGKTPVVLVATKGKPGFLVAFWSGGVEAIRRERALALDALDRGDPGEGA